MTLKTTFGVYEGVYLRVGKYQADNSVAIEAWNQQDGPIATLTVCLCDRSLGRKRHTLIRTTARGRLTLLSKKDSEREPDVWDAVVTVPIRLLSLICRK